MRQLVMSSGESVDLRADENIFSEITLHGYKQVTTYSDEDSFQNKENKLRFRRQQRKNKNKER